MVRGSATDALKVSPVRTSETASESFNQTVISVPGGRLRDRSAAGKGVRFPELPSDGTAGCALLSIVRTGF
jgi:hypothetical protein